MARGRKGSVSAFKTTGKKAGVNNARYQANAGITPRGGGINLGSLLGGLFGGSNKTVDYAQQDFERQKQLMDKMYEMSAPYSTYGVTGSNVVDQDGKTITSSLSPELQAQYDALLGRAGMTADRVAQLSGSPQELQQAIYQEQQALLQPSQDQARAQLDEQQIARGMLGSTGGGQQRGALETSIGMQNQQALANALQTSQSILDMERGRQSTDLSNALTLAGQPNQMLAAGGQYAAGANITGSGVSGASINIANQLATRDATRNKGLWDMMGMSNSGGSGGLFGQLGNLFK
jgi:hypothetical protein